MILKNAVFALCLIVLFIYVTGVLVSPDFADWKKKGVAEYYIEESLDKTGSANVVDAIVWDFRSFETLGEETVLFTAAVGVLTVIIFGFKIKREMG